MNDIPIGADALSLAPLLESVQNDGLDYGPAEREFARRLIDLALIEDLALSGDLTAEAVIPEISRARARFVARNSGIISGMQILSLIFQRFESIADPSFLVSDGDRVEAGDCLAKIEGSARALLSLERTALNFLGRLSGIATLTARFVEKTQGTKARILDTRKTTPGWRLLEKQAVRCGGGYNHRLGLFDAVLIKDNHLAWIADATDPVGKAVSSARSTHPSNSKRSIEIEVDSLEQLDRALVARPDIILTDNFTAEQLREAVHRRDRLAPEILLEVSGGVTLETAAELARTGVDRISVGALTHSAPSLDIALDCESGPGPATRP